MSSNGSTTPPAVTVLLCVFNGEAHLREAVDSVLAQTFGALELLVVDDASTDATASILASYSDPRLRIISNSENLGLTRSLNLGLRAARGMYVARHDADDLSHPRRIEKQFAFLQRNPEVPLVGTQFISIDDRGRRRPPHLWTKCRTSVGILWQFMFENPFVHSAVMFRRDIVLQELGGYDESYRTNQDYELWSRMARRHPLRNLGESLVRFRSSAGSISSGYSAEAINRVRGLLIANRIAILGDGALAEAGLDTMLDATNPKHPSELPARESFTRAVHALYDRFIEVHPEARGVAEIRAHAASLITRVAIAYAREAPLAMLGMHAESLRWSAATFAVASARFLAMSVAGARRPIRRAAK